MAGEISKHYAGEGAREYFENVQQGPIHRGYQLDAAFFVPYLKPEFRILDFGCGIGGMLRSLAKSVTRADGLEVNPYTREVAQQTGLTIFPSLESLPQDPVYDVVFTNHVLEHVRDVPWTLEALRAHIKPGGLLLVKLPIDDIRSRAQRAYVPDDPHHHLHTWTPRLFGNVLVDSGYRVKECRIVTSTWNGRLFWLRHLRLEWLAYWLFAVAKSRRQLFAVGEVPA